LINIHFSSKKNKKKFQKKSFDNFNKLITNINKDISNSSKTLNILNTKFKFNFNLKDLRRFKKFNTVAIIGMGGSILGAAAIYDFLKFKIKKKFYFFDNLDQDSIQEIKQNEDLNKVLFLIISKSGNTIETLSNTFSLGVLNKNSKNIIVIAERKNNLLFSLSKKLNLFFIEHKKHVGGRYSVLSETGVIPAYLMGLNIEKLRSNIQKFLKGKNKIILRNNVIKLASFMSSKKFNNLIFLNYIPQLEKFLYWCQQLIAESLGKNKLGFLPVVSNAPKDHHSLLQLYLDGPKDKLFTIFSYEGKLKKKTKFNMLVKEENFLNKKSLSEIKIAQKNALIKVLKKKDIPFREFKFKKIDETILGELFSYFIVETVLIGKLLKIDPFNQPAVEEVKILTKKFLSKKNQK
tara:strand:- start:7911 stop:9125 length:1215 start_codon:yes stop_codon:yes gene_type:complete